MTEDVNEESLYDRLTSDDILASFEYFFNNKHSQDPTPEKSIMMSVLVFGLIDFLSANRKEHYEDARRWFFDTPADEVNWLYSFENIAHILQFSAEKFRARILKLRSENIHFAVDGKTIKSDGRTRDG